MTDYLESLEDKKKLAQNIVDSIGFVKNGRLTPDFHGGAILGIVVDVVVFAMTYPAIKAGNDTNISEKIVLELYSSVGDDKKAIDISKVNKELNDLSEFISNNTPTTDEKKLNQIANKFFELREKAIIIHPSQGNCDVCGQPRSSCECITNIDDSKNITERIKKAKYHFNEFNRVLKDRGLSGVSWKSFVNAHYPDLRGFV